MTQARLLRGTRAAAPRSGRRGPTHLRTAQATAPHRPSRGLRGRLRQRRVRIVVALLTVYLLWGSTYIAMDVAIAAMPPMLLMAARFALAGAVLYGIAIGRGAGGRPTLLEWWHATINGGVMLVGGTGLISLAMLTIGAGTAALLSATVPVWLALFARLAFGDRLSVRAWAGLALGVVGVAVLVDPAGGGFGGMALAILGAMAWAFGSVRSRGGAAPSRPLLAASMEMLGASVLFLIVAIVLGEPADLDVAAIDLGAVLSAVYLVTAGSIVAFTAYRWLLANAATSLVGTHAYVNPIVAVLLAWALLGERLEGRALVAAAVIVVSVVLVVTARPHEPVPAQATSGGDVFAGVRRWRRVVRWPVARRRPERRTDSRADRRTGRRSERRAGLRADRLASRRGSLGPHALGVSTDRPDYRGGPSAGTHRGALPGGPASETSPGAAETPVDHRWTRHAPTSERRGTRRRLRWARRPGSLAGGGRAQRHRQARHRRPRTRRQPRHRG